MVKNPPAMRKPWVRFLGWEDPLEEGMVTQSSILAWRIPMDRGAWWATVHGVRESDMTEQLSITQEWPQSVQTDEERDRAAKVSLSVLEDGWREQGKLHC